MDSTSIVSFNNDSTLQNTLKTDYNINVHELALHAMRDRCLLLQKRINTLESDNMRLKLDSTKPEASQFMQDEDNMYIMNKKIAELTKQKSQLLHHVFMVSCENKNLWSKIAMLNRPEKLSKNLSKQVLRTNTYVHSTPRGSANYQEKYSESSLEEISLKLINSYIQEKSQLVDQYEQMTQLQNSDDDNLLNLDSIGFAYIDDPGTDSLRDIQNQMSKMELLKKDLAKQEQDLKLVIHKIETIVNEGYKCPTCASKNIKTSENKEIETSDSLANFATPVDSTNYNDNFSDLNNVGLKKENQEIVNVLSPMDAAADKICPMCGHTYEKDVEFSEFQSHVESHFTGEIELGSVIDTYNTIDTVPDSVDMI